MPASARQFLPFVKEKFPKLAEQYDKWYAKNGYAPEKYRQDVSARVRRIREKFGFAARPWEGDRPVVKRAQLSLAWEAEPGSGDSGQMRSCAAG